MKSIILIKHKKLVSIICFLFLHCVFNAGSVIGDELNYSEADIERYYTKIKSADFEERNEAVNSFINLKPEKYNEEMIVEIKSLFIREMNMEDEVYKFFTTGGTTDTLPTSMTYQNSEAYGLYRVNLCHLAGMIGDKKLLPLLVKKCLRSDVLLDFGDDAVQLILDGFSNTSNPIRKMTTISVLGEMVKPKKKGYVAKGKNRTKIKNALIKATNDENKHVRTVSVRALGNSGDKDVISVLEKVAREDKYKVKKKDKLGKEIEEIYPVREEAKKALEKL